jgi:HemY protein
MREENIRKAASVLEGVWKLGPHPEIARTYVRARSGDSTIDRLKRADKLEALRPNNVESLLVVAQAALDAQDFTKARAKAEAAARMEPRESAYLLLANIEEAETGDQGRVRHWMAQALRAPRDPAWVADGFVSEKWLPVSPVTGRIDAFEWKAPFGQIEGPLEEGSISAEHAIASLPPVTDHASVQKAEQLPKPSMFQVQLPEEPVATAKSQLAVAAKPPAPANVKQQDAKAPKNEKEPVPFFGHAPDDPGVKDKNGAQSPTRLRLF